MTRITTACGPYFLHTRYLPNEARDVPYRCQVTHFGEVVITTRSSSRSGATNAAKARVRQMDNYTGKTYNLGGLIIAEVK